MEKRNAEIELAKLIAQHESLIKKYDKTLNSIYLVFSVGLAIGLLLPLAARYIF